MELEKETKGTVRYKEVDDGKDIIIGTLYIKKSALTQPYPEKVRVIIKY